MHLARGGRRGQTLKQSLEGEKGRKDGRTEETRKAGQTGKKEERKTESWTDAGRKRKGTRKRTREFFEEKSQVVSSA